jgi:hypothetical protein
MALFRRYLVARTGPSEGRLTTGLRQPAERRLNSSSRPFPDICVRPQRAESAPFAQARYTADLPENSTTSMDVS